jgi:hypothetical protein
VSVYDLSQNYLQYTETTGCDNLRNIYFEIILELFILSGMNPISVS